eukprot:gene8208-15754_t
MRIDTVDGSYVRKKIKDGISTHTQQGQRVLSAAAAAAAKTGRLMTLSWTVLPQITIHGVPIDYEAPPTYLGVVYDAQLTFSPHVDNRT